MLSPGTSFSIIWRSNLHTFSSSEFSEDLNLVILVSWGPFTFGEGGGGFFPDHLAGVRDFALFSLGSLVVFVEEGLPFPFSSLRL